MKNKSFWLGALLTFSGLVGYITVADDFRHVGEFAAVSAVLITGLVLIVISIRSKKIMRDTLSPVNHPGSESESEYFNF